MERQPDQITAQNESQKSDTEPFPEGATITLPEPPEGKDTTSQSRDEKKRRKRRYKRWLRPQVIVNGVLAFIGLGSLALFAYQTWQAGLAAYIDQRAWVTVAKAELLKPTAVNEKPQIVVNVFNSGKTPALEVRVLGVVYLAAEEPGSVNFGDISDYPSAVLGPAAPPTPVFLERGPLDEEEELTLRDNSNGLYVHGEIRYKDVFGKSHSTGFCFSVRQKDIKPEAASLMTACERLNWAD